MKLTNYMIEHNMKKAQLAKKIGKSRQNIEHWVKRDASVELTDIGIRVRLPSGLIVHESQVAK